MSEPTPEAASADAEQEAPKASKLPIILAAVNFVAILGLGGYFVYTQKFAAAQGGDKGEAKAEEGEHGGEHGEKKEEGGHGGGHGAAPEHGEAAEGEGHGGGHGGAEGHGEDAAETGSASGPLLALESMVTNMGEPDSDRYLKVSMQVRLTSEAARPEVEAQLVPVRNQILLFLSSLSVEDTVGADNKRAIQRKVKRIANEAMPTSRITEVYFTEFVIQ